MSALHASCARRTPASAARDGRCWRRTGAAAPAAPGAPPTPRSTRSASCRRCRGATAPPGPWPAARCAAPPARGRRLVLRRPGDDLEQPHRVLDADRPQVLAVLARSGASARRRRGGRRGSGGRRRTARAAASGWRTTPGSGNELSGHDHRAELRRDVVAVAVDERPPVRRRVQHVLGVPRRSPSAGRRTGTRPPGRTATCAATRTRARPAAPPPGRAARRQTSAMASSTSSAPTQGGAAPARRASAATAKPASTASASTTTRPRRDGARSHEKTGTIR